MNRIMKQFHKKKRKLTINKKIRKLYKILNLKYQVLKKGKIEEIRLKIKIFLT